MNTFNDNLYAGKVVLVTGGGTGIGKAIATAFGQLGAKIVIASRKREVLEAAANEFKTQGIDCLAVSTDIRDNEEVKRLIALTVGYFGRLDIVVNNAAGNFAARIEDLSTNAFKTVVDIDLLGTFNVSKAAFDGWLKTNGGIVINITAPFQGGGAAYQAHAAAAKAGVDSFTRSAAVEWLPLGIRVNAIAPGQVDSTEGTERMGKALTYQTNTKRQACNGNDIANTALFLASDAAAFITGQIICVDNGGSIDMLKIPVYPDPNAE